MSGDDDDDYDVEDGEEDSGQFFFMPLTKQYSRFFPRILSVGVPLLVGDAEILTLQFQ